MTEAKIHSFCNATVMDAIWFGVLGVTSTQYVTMALSLNGWVNATILLG